MSNGIPGLLIAMLAGVAQANTAAPQGAERFDIVVVSGSSGGFAAALAAGRMGAKVALIEDTPVLGGHLSNGLTVIDSFSLESLSGIVEEFRLEVAAHYAPIVQKHPDVVAEGAVPPEKLGEFAPIDGRSWQSHSTANGTLWEPRVSDRIFKTMIATVPNVHVFYNTYATDVVVKDRRIVGVVTRDQQHTERTFYGDVIIDATYEGDVAAWAGVPYRVGREARSTLEPHAGEIYFLDETGEIMDGSSGRQDRAVVSYGLRLTAEVFGEPAPLLSAPPGYRKENHERAGCITYTIDKITRQFQVNMNPVGSELQGVNWDWPEATHEERKRMYEIYKNHALGYVYYLQNECGFKNIGLAQDAYPDNGNLPYRLYVREARRIVGEQTMTEADINPFILGRGLIPAIRTDSIAIGHYPIDAKPVSPKTDFDQPDKGDGDFFLYNVAQPFQVPYGAIVPQRIDGLLVPVAMSATHVAFSAIRMEPTWMATGQAAGVAAVLSLRDKLEVRDVSIERLQRELLREKARLMFYWDVPLEHPAFQAVQWLSVKQGVHGYPDREFRPDSPITRAEAAAWIVDTLQLWPSVSNVHFADVSYEHPEFREIETLFNHGLLKALGVMPQWPQVGLFNPTRNIGFSQKHGTFGKFEPDKPLLWGELLELLQQWKLRRPDQKVSGAALSKRPSAPELLEWAQQILSASKFSQSAAGRRIRLDAPMTRAEAAMLLAALTDAH